MSNVYRVKASELDSNFLAEIKAAFGEKEIEIVVSELDETKYLLRSETNKARLLQAVENVKNDRNLIEIDWQDL